MAVQRVLGPIHWHGLSTDVLPRPADDPPNAPGNGSTFSCLDTGDVYLFNAGRWAPRTTDADLGNDTLIQILAAVNEVRDAIQELHLQMAS